MKEKSHRKRESVLEKTASVFDLPGDIIAGMPKFTITGNRKMYIENHKGILEYGDEIIIVNCGKIILKVAGDKLELRSMNDDEMMIEGFFTGMEFEY